jgi:hypothetical protein
VDIATRTLSAGDRELGNAHEGIRPCDGSISGENQWFKNASRLPEGAADGAATGIGAAARDDRRLITDACMISCRRLAETSVNEARAPANQRSTSPISQFNSRRNA